MAHIGPRMSFASFFVAFIVFAAQVRADCAGASQAQPLYRDYSSGGGDHFYTTDLAEYNSANANNGYSPDGIRALVFTTQVAGSVKFIRLYNADVTDHFYTTNATEATDAAAAGYAIEDKATMYIYPTQLCGSVPFYRSYSAGGTDHFYTIDAAERDGAVSSGWAYEFIAGYVFDPAGLASSAGAASQPASKPAPSSSAAVAKSSATTPTSASSAPPSGPTVTFGTGPVLPASTTILGSDSASSTPSTSAGARLLFAPGSCVVALFSLAVTLL
ncbi:hypothetical protein C8R44DRAFT_683573 [Mycena epipterygia]|nr:hypothetical protein C8R44DRAFT_683573 [Mycena epipterygia]